MNRQDVKQHVSDLYPDLYSGAPPRPFSGLLFRTIHHVHRPGYDLMLMGILNTRRS